MNTKSSHSETINEKVFMIDSLVRDITKVGSMSKSEARRKIEEILKAQRKELSKTFDKTIGTKFEIAENNFKAGQKKAVKEFIEILNGLEMEVIDIVNRWGRRMEEKKIPIKQMTEDSDEGWFDYDELTASINGNIRKELNNKIKQIKKKYEL